MVDDGIEGGGLGEAEVWGHARHSCDGTMEAKITMIREGTGLSYMVYTGDLRYWYCWSSLLRRREERGIARKNMPMVK